MKTIKLLSSLLLIRIRPEKDEVTCYFIFFISWNCFKFEKHTFDLNKIELSLVKKFYDNLANEWDRKYRI